MGVGLRPGAKAAGRATDPLPATRLPSTLHECCRYPGPACMSSPRRTGRGRSRRRRRPAWSPGREDFTMPAKPRWLLVSPDAISQLEQLDRQLLTRRDIERLFGVAARCAPPPS